ncbi:hypothetical protein PFICI_03140 [Pestalotiopsis fici W106-1]|uniref:Zn(2)-C6 fungal-type domain-containing protein n=1 Tax=Pestalotiopsis fici (strain W106-1 / CGMCC3.15140) TaxID=1229662 RepID=W3XGF5_PESFW|nr:uncharacterized protein PFICI_03140 [Pestalotiopsis fici W106-1]ETS85115.1 hypothetical protein PFICI_03140 [Pestalotiopsis fici W106-1]
MGTEPATSGRRRNEKGRSKIGCLTCREKHVKCDEQLPACRRCNRLGLDCRPFWLKTVKAPQPSRSRCRILRPKTSAAQHIFDHTETSSPLAEASEADYNACLQPAILHSPDLTQRGDAMTSWLLASPANTEKHAQHLNSTTIDGFQSHESDTERAWLLENDIIAIISNVRNDLTQTQIPPQPSSSHIALPNALVLSLNERRALRHYETAFTATQTTKDVQWALPTLLLRQALHCSTMMHFILALSLFDLDTKSDSILGNRVLAIHHFNAGTSRLVSVLANTTTYNHVEILWSFYCIYVCVSKQKCIDKDKLNRLSRTVSQHLTAYLVDCFTINSDGSTAFDSHEGTVNTLSSPATKSLWCKLLFWIYQEDASSASWGCNAEVAQYFAQHPDFTRHIWELSRSTLMLNWGLEYPENQCFTDMELSHVVDLSVDLTKLRFQKYMLIFKMVASSAVKTTEATTFGAAAVAIFHAIEICYYLHLASHTKDERREAVNASLTKLLHAARQVFSYSSQVPQLDFFQWALFIAGAATEDAIHADWISDHIPPSRLKFGFNMILSLRTSIGPVVDMEIINKILAGWYQLEDCND